MISVRYILLPGQEAREASLPFWAGNMGHGVLAAERVCETLLTGIDWTNRFGDNDTARVLIRILEPAAISGVYSVTLKRKTEASAAKIEAPAQRIAA